MDVDPADVRRHLERIKRETTAERLEILKSYVGCIVQITGTMADDPAPLAIGDRGVVRSCEENTGILNVRWESGRTLRLLPHDPYEVVEAAVGVKIRRVLTGQEYTITELDETTFVAEQLTDHGVVSWTGKREELIINVTYRVAR